jgi:hypothetical protein
LKTFGIGSIDMTPWYAPTGFKDNIRRLMALRSALVLWVVLSLLVTELRFDWIEGVVGAYLVSSNRQRPESGGVWDQGHQSDLARKRLSQYMDERSDVRREMRRATTMGQVIDGMDDERGAMISAGHFVKLYQKLPPVLSHEIISPYALLAHLSDTHWKRTFFERQGDEQLNIYLLDAHNQVLRRLSVGSVLIEHIHKGEAAVLSRLDQLGDFAGQIYSAQQFFKALNSLSEEEKKGILDSPGNLLAVSGRIVRVGISSQSMAGVVDIGFEVDSAQGAKVILTQGMASHIRRLQWILEVQAPAAPQPREGDIQ